MSIAATVPPQSVHELPVEHLFTLHLEVTRHVFAPAAAEGASLHLGILDGSFAGERLRGRVAPLVGHATATLRGDGYARISYGLVLVTDERVVVSVDGTGITHLTNPHESRVAFTFHTADDDLGWLNQLQGVATGIGGRDEVTFEVYRMR